MGGECWGSSHRTLGPMSTAWALVREVLLAQGGDTQQRFGEMRSTLHPSMLAASVLAVASVQGLCVRAWVTVSPSIWLETQDCSRCGVPRASDTASFQVPACQAPGSPMLPRDSRKLSGKIQGAMLPVRL